MNIPISVIIVSYNRERLITLAIESVLSQKFTDFELFIIDDASTDNTENVVKKYLIDKRVKYIKNTKGNSIAETRNSAWAHVNGKYIAILDSDDIWSDNLKLTKQFEYLESHPENVLVGSGAIIIDDKGLNLNKTIKPILDEEIRKDFLIKNPFFHSSVMYRYDIIKQIGGYNDKIKYGEDLDLWLRIGEIGKLYNIPEVLIKYRIHNDNESSKHGFNAVLDTLKIISNNRKKYNVSWSIFLKKILGKLRGN